MYKYQCSKNDCNAAWTLREGRLNGFVLTCPVCGKGRGIFVSQSKNEGEQANNDRTEEMVITMDIDFAKSVEDFTIKIDGFVKNHSLLVLSKEIESSGRNIVCSIRYKIKE